MLFKIINLLFIINMSLSDIIETPVDYSHHKLIKILPKRIRELNLLEMLGEKFNIDFWNSFVTDMRPIMTLISPEQFGFLKALNRSHIKYEVSSRNIQKAINDENAEIEAKRRSFSLKSFDYNSSYYKYDEIVAELQKLGLNSNKAIYKSIGKSYEKRDIPSITITNPTGNQKPIIVLECGIHAREWISTATCLWIVNTLLTEPSYDKYLNKFEFFIVPILNPDGYVFTHMGNRFWRKTRSGKNVKNPKCVGADLNRNWDSDHCKSGASVDPCTDMYCGAKPFSEIEAQLMANQIMSIKDNMAVYFSIHSYGQLFMYPYSYKNSKPSTHNELKYLADKAVNAIRAVNGLVFKSGNVANVIYKASGSSIDWIYDKAGVKRIFALELRDTGRNGFMLPSNQIMPAGMETLAEIMAIIDSIDIY